MRLTCKHLHRVIYKRPGSSHEVKKNIRDFTGFHFADTVGPVSWCQINAQDARKVVHDKIAKFTNGQLKEILALFGLQVGGSKDTLIDNVIDFLNSPWDTKKAAAKVYS
jgi:protein DEK